MKKILLYSSVAIILMAACSKEKADNSNNLSNDKATYQFTISANASEMESNGSNPAQIGTKTSYAGETTFSWTLGDQISVLFHDAGDNNAFYTLTATSVDGENATFTGTIDSGWEVGAADTKAKWALYPAGDHTYSADAPVFAIPNETDFSSTHFSANLPMYAIGEDNGAGSDVYAFKHVKNVGAYKLTFNNLDVSKVRLVVEQKESYFLNGTFQLAQDGTKYGFNPWSYSYSSDPKKICSYTANVVGKTVSFYIPFKTWEANFKPVLTLYDANTGFILGSWTAGTAFPYTTGNVVVAKPFSVSGTGTPFANPFGIDWASVSASATGVGNDCINSIKAAADESYFYLYLELDSTKLLQGDYKYANQLTLYVGTEASASTSWMWNETPNANNTYTISVSPAWLMYNGAPKISGSGYDILNGSNVATIGDYYYYEIKFNRDNTSVDLTTATTLHIGALVYYQKYHDGTTSGSLGGGYYYSPYNVNSLLVVSMPTYVAP